MVSTTRFYARLLSACALLLASACTQETGSHGFQIQDVRLRLEPRRLGVGVSQELRLSRTAEEALRHGVPLTIVTRMELRNQESLTLLADGQARHQIRYLPLSEHFELLDLVTGQARTFPRLRHAVAALARLQLRFDTGPLAPGNYEFRARTKLDRSSLPAPMQLPALVSVDWRHDSDWSTWPLKINA